MEIDIDKDKEICYTYDNNGNILTKSVNGAVVEYRYKEDSDQLVAFGDETFAYDVIGNPTTFRGMTAEWQNGRQLKSLDDGANKVEYTYDGKGLRRTKKVGGLITTYTYDSNGKLIREVGGKTIEYVYGADGIIGIIMDQAPYVFRKNLFGDVTHIYNENGEIVGKYSYTAFGECTIDLDIGSVASNNPIRYRSYYYDDETSLYYLKTRYYDPEIGRFITIDGIEYLDPETINGLNLYAYCGNNPVSNVDPNGNAWWHWLLGAVVVVAVTIATAGVAAGAAWAIGTAVGVGSSLVGATVTGAVIGGLVAGGVELISQGIASNWQTVDLGALAIESFTGSLYGAASGMMGATTSVGVRLGMRATIVASSGINAALHGINQGKSFGDIMLDVGISMGVGLVLQGAMLGLDARAGKFSKTVLESYAIDGFTFMLKHKLLVGGISVIKSIWRNRNDWVDLIIP